MRIILSIGIGVRKYQANYDSLNRYRKSEWFTERVSQRLNIDKKHIYINRKITTTNTFLKINDDYYRVINSEKDEYLLGKIYLINPTTEKAEVNNITFLYRYSDKISVKINIFGVCY